MNKLKDAASQGYFDVQSQKWVAAPKELVDEINKNAVQIRPLTTYVVRIVYKMTSDFEKPRIQFNQDIFKNVMSIEETDHYLVISFRDNTRRMIKHDDIINIEISEAANESENCHN